MAGRGSGAKRGASDAAAPVAKRARAGASHAKLTFKSPAEFFAENKNIAGFDNPGKSLYTTVRELVENGLDAAEAVRVTPVVDVRIECVGREEFRSIVGMGDGLERVDSALYKDVETGKERKKREAKEMREVKKAKAAEARKKKKGGEGDVDADFDPTQSQAQSQSQSQAQTQASQTAGAAAGLGTTTPKGRTGGVGSGTEIFRVTVKDNGTGMAHDDVPNMMGRVLTGTKYCVRQSRGKFGLGSKMALIWSKMSTGLPVHIRTAQAGGDITDCVLDIDMAANKPSIISHTTEPNPDGWRGSEVAVTIQGSWTSYRAKLLQYMRQMAVITPYAQFRFLYRADPGREDKNFELLFARRTDVMPRSAKEVKHHPSSVDQYRLKRLVGEVRANMTIHKFLTTQFVSVPDKLATRLVSELRFERTMQVKELDDNHIRQLHELLQVARFDKPDGDSLSPAGEYNLRLGITKEFSPAMVATHAESADVFEGHAFIVEAGVALGGTGMKPGLNIFRFANRIPLLFEGGNDVVSKTAKDSIRWSSYKISTATDRIGVICSIVSTKVPFKGTGKEYIGDDADSIKAAVKRALMQCCLQLKSKLVRRAAIKDAKDRKQLIIKYAPDVANALSKVFESIRDDATAEADAGPDVADVVQKFRSKEISAASLKEKLIEHVDKFDKEQALDVVTTTGRDAKSIETLFFAPRAAASRYIRLGTASAKMVTAEPRPQLLLLSSLEASI